MSRWPVFRLMVPCLPRMCSLWCLATCSQARHFTPFAGDTSSHSPTAIVANDNWSYRDIIGVGSNKQGFWNSHLVAKKNWKNPFYALLIPVGLLFVVTGFAYGYMAFQAVNTGVEGATVHADHPLFLWLKKYGDWAILGELAVLAVLTVGAIATDDWWMDEAPPGNSDDVEPESNPSEQSGETHADG